MPDGVNPAELKGSVRTKLVDLRGPIKKLVDYKELLLGGLLSLILWLLSMFVMEKRGLPPDYTNIASFIIFLVGLLFTFLVAIVSGIQKFRSDFQVSYKNIQKHGLFSCWSIFKNNEEVKKYVSSMVKCHENIETWQTDSAKKTFYKKIVQTVCSEVNKLSSLADQFEFVDNPPSQFDFFVKAFESLNQGDIYKATSISNMWNENNELEPKLFSAMEEAIEKKKIKVTRIFIVPKVCEADWVAIQKHKVMATVKLIERDYLKKHSVDYNDDVGIFNDEFVGILTLGAGNSVDRITYHFDPKSVNEQIGKFNQINSHIEKGGLNYDMIEQLSQEDINKITSNKFDISEVKKLIKLKRKVTIQLPPLLSVSH